MPIAFRTEVRTACPGEVNATAASAAIATAASSGARRCRRTGSRSAYAAATTFHVRSCATASSGARKSSISLEGVEAAAEPRVDGAAGQVEELGDLAGGVLEQVAEHDHGALVGRER